MSRSNWEKSFIYTARRERRTKKSLIMRMKVENNDHRIIIDFDMYTYTLISVFIMKESDSSRKSKAIRCYDGYNYIYGVEIIPIIIFVGKIV